MKNLEFAVILLAAAALTGPGAFAQDSSQTTPAQQSKPQTTKKPKVWTDDNIDAIRTPSDALQDQEAQATAAQQAAKQKAAAEAAMPSPPAGFVKPTTVQQADSLLAQAQSNLKSQQEYVQQTQKELATAPDAYKARLQWRIESRGQIIKKYQSDIATLQKDRDELAKQSASAPANSASGGQQ